VKSKPWGKQQVQRAKRKLQTFTHKRCKENAADDGEVILFLKIKGGTNYGKAAGGSLNLWFSAPSSDQAT